MNLDAMLKKCLREQWSVGDLDWNQVPKSMSKETEMAIVQYFTDMAGIERLAGALFGEQRKRAKDPTLERIFATFERDEIRHSHAAQMLADHYDVHKYKAYRTNEHLARFHPRFVEALQHLSAEIANVYITAGELILDVALLRSLNDYVDDVMSDAAMALINRDESRHIAVDFHMVEYYSSDAYQRDLANEPRRSLRKRLKGWAALGKMMYHARPFFRDVFFTPMDITDPSGKRLREAFKRIQLVASKPNVSKRPFVRFMLTMQDLFNHPVIGIVFARALIRITGSDPRVMVRLYTDEEEKRAQRMSFDDLAEEALAAKFA